MNEWHVIFDVWRSWRSQVYQNREDIEENVDTANNVETEKEKKMRLIWIKCVNWRRRSSKWNTGTAWMVKIPKIWEAETWNEVDKMGMQWSMGKKMMKEEMENSNVIMCHFWQSLWWRNKRKTQKKIIPPNLYTIHAKCVTIIPEDIQIASQYM